MKSGQSGGSVSIPSSGGYMLVAVLLAMISFDYQITLKSIYGAPPFLAAAAAVFAGAGLLSQALLAFTSAKDRWLATRFAAERLRCLKFQLFAVVEECTDARNLALKVKQRTNELLAALEQELMGGRAAIMEFSPFDVLPLQKGKTGHRNVKLMDEAAAVYDMVRFSVEAQHFEERISRPRTGKQISVSSERV